MQSNELHKWQKDFKKWIWRLNPHQTRGNDVIPVLSDDLLPLLATYLLIEND